MGDWATCVLGGIAAECLVAGAALAEDGELAGAAEDGQVGEAGVAARGLLAVAALLAVGRGRGLAPGGGGGDGDGRGEEGDDGGELHVDGWWFGKREALEVVGE